ncbi:MAG TPA: thioredoxin [Candidatus Scatomonas pullistercoris]|uniref:Thioredoxin n=1 Tax=Candidatus Scatomonas pullistercoris TaxID=2840920 RepID=A0A9D1TBU9_9FIRM|nr:thioredoxin [Candidatus Scatomonas pullistercoris]
MVNVLNESNFDAEVLQASGGVVVDMYADWCGPCKMMAPVVEALSASHPEIKFCKLNVDQAPSIAARYRVMSIPTFLVFRNGNLAGTIVGGMEEEELESAVSEALSK